MSTKRRSKRRIRVPFRYNDTLCELNTKMSCKDNEGTNNEMNGGEKVLDDGRVENGDIGEGVQSVSKEFNVTEYDFPLLNEDNEILVDCNDAEINEGNTEHEQETDCNNQLEQDCSIKEGMNHNLNSPPNNSNETNDKETVHTNYASINKTYVDLVKPKGDKDDNKLSQIPITVEDGREVVIFYEELVLEGSRKCSLTLCGHFVGFKMTYSELRYNLVRMWGRFGLKDIVSQNGVFLFKFRESEGLNYVLENGPWMVNNKPLMVQRWDPSIAMDKKDPETLPCWIKLHNVPLEAWTLKGISTIASGLGKPLIMDKTTTRLCKEGTGNFGYARVLVEINAEKEFKEMIEICYKSKNLLNLCSKFVKVEYSWKPPKCIHCKVFGHTDGMCGRKQGKDKNQTTDVGQNGLNQRENGRQNDDFSRVWNGGRNNNKNSDRVGNGGGKKVNQAPKFPNPRMEFRPVNRQANSKDARQYSPPKEKSTEKGMESNNQKKTQESPQNAGSKSPWRVNKEVVEDIRRSANKFAILEEITDSEDQEIQLQNEKDIVNKFVKYHRQPTLEDSKNWSKDMFKQFKEQWEKVWNSECLDKEDVYDDGDGTAEGMCNKDMQKEVRKLIKDENLSLCATLETHLKEKQLQRDKPWVLLGDWNVSLNIEDHSEGGSCKSNDMIDFQECIDNIEVEDLNCSGIHFTWVQSRQDPSSGILKKIDRVAQRRIDKDPHNASLKKQEAEILKEYSIAKKDEEKLLVQKAKIDWLCEGDKNSNFFHTVIKGRAHRNRIDVISNEKGERFEGNQVAEQFVHHFQNFLGNASPVQKFDMTKLNSKTISNEDAEIMVRSVSNEEVKATLFDICDNKAPGPYGYTAKFYKKAWSIVGSDVCNAIKEFFRKGRMLGEINATLITLVPKGSTPQKVSDYRPIACYNVLYKIISKILTNRIKHALSKLVDPSQSAFIPRRQITDNILLVQEFLKGYNRKNGARRVALKIDIQKAYDIVSWDFLEASLQMFHFPNKMIEWIMVCIRTVAFTININNERFWYFKGGRGLRQGDSISPYLHSSDGNDLLVLCYGDLKSMQVIKRAMDTFSSISGLHPNIGKSIVFFKNVQDHLSFTDCKCLIDRVKTKVNNWMNRMISYAGRLQLITSILSSMQVYWASVFILPKTVIKDIDKILKGFLWCQRDLSKGKAKIA
ncbi:RNA-directed DNA polymerase, eukaryota, reverse transcriptase zinc-binding domain protein [Tanacetum coccineum]